jgi:phytoene dehydrogenase-like protein
MSSGPPTSIQIAADLAPSGQAVVSVLVHFAPHDLRPAWDSGAREHLGDRVMALIEPHAPGLSASVLARRVLTPIDIEERYGVSGGHIHHGEHALDQLLVRPAPGSVGSRTPVPGLYLSGSGSHPGGGLTCGPGARAAATILREGAGRDRPGAPRSRPVRRSRGISGPDRRPA